MTSPADLLREMDARARAIVVFEIRRMKADLATPRHCHREIRIVRAASRERMRIRHALRALESPARALALLRVV